MNTILLEVEKDKDVYIFSTILISRCRWALCSRGDWGPPLPSWWNPRGRVWTSCSSYSSASCSLLRLRSLRGRHELRRPAEGGGWEEGGSHLTLPLGGWIQGWLSQQSGLPGTLPPLTTSPHSTTPLIMALYQTDRIIGLPRPWHHLTTKTWHSAKVSIKHNMTVMTEESK